MKKYFLKPGTYVNSNTLAKDSTPPGLNLENYIVNVINNPTCCTKLIGNLYVDNPLDLTFQTVKRLGGTTSSIQLTTDRLGLLSDSTATTQTTAVIQATDTNSGIAIVPNGTGAFTLDVPDGTATGGNARGSYAVDLQMFRGQNIAVASGEKSFVVGQSNQASGDRSIAMGNENKATGQYSVAIGQSNQAISRGAVALGGYAAGNVSSNFATFVVGDSNTASGRYSSVSGGEGNTSSANYCSVSGGESNTASTNSHATVVGGYQNSSTGQYSVSGGVGSIASGKGSIAIGTNDPGAGCVASGIGSVAFGGRSAAQGNYSMTVGSTSLANSGVNSLSFGDFQSNTGSYNATFGRFVSNTNSNNLAFGLGTKAAYKGTFSFQSGMPNTNSSNLGIAQAHMLTMQRTTDLTTGATATLFIDGSTDQLNPYNTNTVWNVTIKYTAVVTLITGTATGVSVGDCKNEVLTIGFKKIGGTSSVVGSLNTLSTNEDLSMSTASFGVSAGASQEMKLDFTAPTFLGGGSVTTRVVAKVELTECAY